MLGVVARIYESVTEEDESAQGRLVFKFARGAEKWYSLADEDGRFYEALLAAERDEKQSVGKLFHRMGIKAQTTHDPEEPDHQGFIRQMCYEMTALEGMIADADEGEMVERMATLTEPEEEAMV
jgi:hypothetical protein